MHQRILNKESKKCQKVSCKRQITLTVDQCKQAGIEPGDDYQSFVLDGHITIIKKERYVAQGILKHVNRDINVTDEDSLQGL